MSNENVKIPEFEMVGPPCKEPNCSGVYILCMDLKSKRFYYKCHKCGNSALERPMNLVNNLLLGMTIIDQS